MDNLLYELQYGSLRRYSRSRIEYLKKVVDPDMNTFLMLLSDGSVVERNDSTDGKIFDVVNKQQIQK